MFTKEQLQKARDLSILNHELEGEIGFEFHGTWITNPFMDETARFELKDYEHMCKHYGEENVAGFIQQILNESQLKENEIQSKR